MPLDWDKYSSLLLMPNQRPTGVNGFKRIAVLGLPLIDRALHPLKIALMECIDRKPDWVITFFGDSYPDTFRLLRKLPCDGILGRIVSPEVAKIAKSLPCPIVNVSSMLKNPGVNTVRRRDRGIGHMCGQHLLDRGFTRFGIVDISPVPGWCFAESLAGFKEVLNQTEKQLEIATYTLDLHLKGQNNFSQFRQWLKSQQRPYALFVTDDRIALTAIEACREEGYRIPHDVAVICASGTPETLSSMELTLTHPVMDGVWLLSAACDRLEELMKNPQQPVKIMELSVPGLVQGESTNTRAISDPVVLRAVEFIDRYFHRGINVPDVVSHLQCSRRSIERRFREQMTVTLHEHIISKRLGESKCLMQKYPNKKLESISKECGFADVQAFRHAFIASEGKTPSNYKKQLGPKS